MAAPRSLTPFVAAVAATALTVGGVLFGTAPVSAAPTQSAECTSALAALEAEFGDAFDIDDIDEAELDALLDEYEALFEEYEALLDELDSLDALDAEAEAEATELQADLDAAQIELDAADLALAEALADLNLAMEGEDVEAIALAQQTFEEAEAAQVLADGRVTEIDDALAAIVEEQSALRELIALAELDLDDLDAALEEIELLFEELFGDFDLERLLELLVTVALECDDQGDTDDDTEVDTAPVATPVTARASFTG